eukprot:5088595-Prymnesium_polylepis.1
MGSVWAASGEGVRHPQLTSSEKEVVIAYNGPQPWHPEAKAIQTGRCIRGSEGRRVRVCASAGRRVQPSTSRARRVSARGERASGERRALRASTR